MYKILTVTIFKNVFGNAQLNFQEKRKTIPKYPQIVPNVSIIGNIEIICL